MSCILLNITEYKAEKQKLMDEMRKSIAFNSSEIARMASGNIFQVIILWPELYRNGCVFHGAIYNFLDIFEVVWKS